MKLTSLLMTFVLLNTASLSWGASAPSAQALADFHTAELVYLQAQIEAIMDANAQLQTAILTDQQSFEKIGEPSFAAIDNALKASGFTVKTWYDFGAKYQQEITQWQQAYPEHVDFVQELEQQRATLLQTYDQRLKQQRD